MKKKQIIKIILTIILSGIFVFSFPYVGKNFTNLPDEHKHLWTAIVVSGIGITIHLFKKRNISDEMRTTAELFEILMFMIIPALTTYEIWKSQIKEQPLIIPAIFLPTIIAWHGIAEYQISKEFGLEGGKLALRFVRRFTLWMGGFGIITTIIIMYLLSLK